MFAARKTDNVSSAANYIEEVFSTWLYTGTGSSQTITNGIDLSGKGGLVWIKARGTTTPSDHYVEDTARGAGNVLSTNLTDTSSNLSNAITSFNSTGFSLGNGARQNPSGISMASWTFRKQAKFFDVVTFTKNASTNQRISHNLGATPGCIIVKSTDAVGNWTVWHRSLASATDSYMILNSTGAATASANAWGSTGPTSTDFGVSSVQFTNGTNYVAYLFAHDAGGFGAAGTDNVITCGSFTQSSAADVAVSLGYEPQWVLVKQSNTTGQWNLLDDMRGFLAGNNSVTSKVLRPNLSNAEADFTIQKTATGFTWPAGQFSVSAGTYIYIAIRRGPMKTPTSGTSVFSPNAQTGAGTTAGQTLTTSFPVDLEISEGRATNSGAYFLDRLRGGQNYMVSASTAAEVNFTGYTPLISFANNTGILDANYGSTSNAYVAWNFRRAPGFFDVVCYTGTGSALNVSHNLGVVPELMIVKGRSFVEDWAVYSRDSSVGSGKALRLNSISAPITTSTYWNATTPTASQFSVGASIVTNTSGGTLVAYLFATVAGVSKVGSYTGNGSSQTINCGFTAGARFILIKRTDSTGDWYVWDTARGIVTANDPHLSLNTTAAEVTTDDSIDPDNSGFIVNQLAATNINVSSATYIYLAIA